MRCSRHPVLLWAGAQLRCYHFHDVCRLTVGMQPLIGTRGTRHLMKMWKNAVARHENNYPITAPARQRVLEAHLVCIFPSVFFSTLYWIIHYLFVRSFHRQSRIIRGVQFSSSQFSFEPVFNRVIDAFILFVSFFVLCSIGYRSTTQTYMLTKMYWPVCHHIWWNCFRQKRWVYLQRNERRQNFVRPPNSVFGVLNVVNVFPVDTISP